MAGILALRCIDLEDGRANSRVSVGRSGGLENAKARRSECDNVIDAMMVARIVE